jgi:hypothetical protein
MILSLPGTNFKSARAVCTEPFDENDSVWLTYQQSFCFVTATFFHPLLPKTERGVANARAKTKRKNQYVLMSGKDVISLMFIALFVRRLYALLIC